MSFHNLLEGGEINAPLLFRDNGNRLCDAFKKLVEHDFIIGMQKIDVQFWIIKNFRFLNRRQTKIFTEDYVEKCISRDTQPCKNPLIEIKNGTVIAFQNTKRKTKND